MKRRYVWIVELILKHRMWGWKCLQVTQLKFQLKQGNLESIEIFFSFFLTMWPVGSQFLDQGLNPHPLHWKHGVLTTGPSGKSISDFKARGLQGHHPLNTRCYLQWNTLVAQMVKNPPAMQETQVHPWVGKIAWRR